MDLDVHAPETGLDRFAPRSEELMDEFYSGLFERAPAATPLFAHTDLQRQKATLLGTLVLLRKSLHNLDRIIPRLQKGVAMCGSGRTWRGAIDRMPGFRVLVAAVVSCCALCAPTVASASSTSAYVTNFNTNGARGASQYDIGAGGELSPKATPTVAAGNQPYAIAVSPDGKSVYVTNFNTNGAGGISLYDVGSGGGLTPKTTATVAAGNGPQAVAVSPDGKSVYVTNFNTDGAGGVSEYDVGAGGELSPKPTATVAGGNGPFPIAVSPGGKSVYVANVNTNGAGGVSQYDVGAGGELSPKATATVAAGNSPQAVAISPDGKSVYVANFNTNGAGGVSQYDVGAGGGLSPKAAPTVAAGNQPNWIAVVPDQGPTASFSDGAAPAGLASSFDGSASNDPDGTVVRYDWDFGDGATLANGGGKPTHTYTTPGTYAVTLTVTDDAGCSTASVFTGQSAYCNHSAAARTTHIITVPPATVSGPPPVAVSGPPPVVVSGLRVSPQKLSIAGREVNGKCVKPTKKNNSHKHCLRAIKLKISYTLNRAGTVTFTLKHKAPGRKVNGKCVKPTNKNKRKENCARLISVHGKRVEPGRAGTNSFSFNGKIGGHKLAPGTYQLTATPTGGKSQIVMFAIVG